MTDQQTWTLTGHMCRHCGGRVLKCATGCGPTPGGNPVFRCADCGAEKSGFKADVICWCGFHHRRNHHIQAYMCMEFASAKDSPAREELEDAFRACGCDPERGEVGIMLEADYRRIIQRLS